MSKITLAEVSTPSNPVAGEHSLFIDSADGHTKRVDSSGTVVDLESGGGGVTDHGALTGLGDDDHTQYLLADGSRALAGSQSCGDNDLTNIKTATFNGEIDNGNSGAAANVDWTAGQKQAITLTDNCTLTFTDPPGGGNFILVLEQDATGGRTVVWPASVQWQGGVAPTLTNGANAIDVVSFYKRATTYLGVAGLNFS